MQMLFEDDCSSERVSPHAGRIRDILTCYAERGRLLADVAQPHIIGLSLKTLKRYCRKFSIAFPDYIPRAMRS